MTPQQSSAFKYSISPFNFCSEYSPQGNPGVPAKSRPHHVLARFDKPEVGAQIREHENRRRYEQNLHKLNLVKEKVQAESPRTDQPAIKPEVNKESQSAAKRERQQKRLEKEKEEIREKAAREVKEPLVG